VAKSEPPCSLNLEYSTYNLVEDGEVIFERLVVEYPDGSSATLTDRVPGAVRLKSGEYVYLDEAKVLRREKRLQAELHIADCIANSGPFTLRLKGHMRSGGRVIESFDTAQRCRPFTYVVRTTRWAFYLTP
jgi:hypothetical protein